MLTVDEALAKINERATRMPAVSIALSAALGHVLAEDVYCDLDSPPYDKSMVDGFAVRSADIAAGAIEFDVVEEVVAGQVPTQGIEAGQATRIMTGAPIPLGADAVVMVEQSTLMPAESPGSHETAVQLSVSAFRVGQNILRRGTSMRHGDLVLSAGRAIGPIEIGVLAEIGKADVSAVAQPSVAVIATGDELVDVGETPAPGQIRNSNGPMLLALAARANAIPVNLGIARDTHDDLRARMARGLEADVLVLSGGVSAGVLDLVPQVLRELHVEEVFHKVSLKPGKPLWFGVRRQEGRQTLVFGLPGNPVSSLVCFELFVRPALGTLLGRTDFTLRESTLLLAREFSHRGDRPTYYPARIAKDRVELLAWQGSADLRTLADATALAYFPAGEARFRAEEPIRVLQLEAR